MQLKRIEDKRHMQDGTVQGIRSGKVFYIYTGRNAWHSTWSQRYSVGCMHTDLSGAKAYAERLRKQGTVIYIEELAALEVRGSSQVWAITQINTGNPLAHYSAQTVRALESRPESGLVPDCLLRVGTDVADLLGSFIDCGRHWAKAPPREHSVMVLTATTNFNLEELTNEPLAAWVSMSSGGAYRLGWLRRHSRCKAEGVSRVVADASRDTAPLDR